MRNQAHRFRAALVAAGLVASAALAHEYTAGALVIGHPWARPTVPGMPMGAAYLSITNKGGKPDALLGASTPAAARVEVHQTQVSDGMARMRPVTALEIPAGATVKVAPGGVHLMLVDLKSALVAGTRVPMTLEFRAAGKVTVELAVENRD